MRAVAILAIGMLGATPGFSHRLDEYLQGTILSIEKTRILGQIILTPGVAVYPFVNSSIDSDGDGTISQAEQRAYAAQVLRDVSLTSDGQPLKIQLLATHFATLADMKEGRGEIQLDFAADLPRGARSRKLTFENHHQIRIAAYSVNTLVPSDPDLRITSQSRNYSQSIYDVEYQQMDVASWPSQSLLLLFCAGLFLLLRAVRYKHQNRRHQHQIIQCREQ